MNEKLVTEFLGTFIFYTVIVFSAVAGLAGNIAPLAIGICLTSLVFASGHRSFAHFNPAVTFSFFLVKKQSFKEMLAYWITVLLAAFSASKVAEIIYPEISNISLLVLNLKAAAASEFIFTFALVWVILNVALAKKLENNNFYGIAIGFIVAAGAFSVGSISGASFNPAVSIGLLSNGIISSSTFFIYTAVQLIAALLAALIFKNLEK